jgi:hypothetical protein
MISESDGSDWRCDPSESLDGRLGSMGEMTLDMPATGGADGYPLWKLEGPG